MRVKVGHAVGHLHSSTVTAFPGFGVGAVCRYCPALATEIETFRIKTPKGSRYKTRVTAFQTCDKHAHKHWREIGFKTRVAAGH
jgi:hypothetical protein